MKTLQEYANEVKKEDDRFLGQLMKLSKDRAEGRVRPVEYSVNLMNIINSHSMKVFKILNPFL